MKRNKNLTLLLLLTIFNTSLYAKKDINIKDYVDRGIHYYPTYVKKGLVKYGKASWYGKPFHGRLTANGERYSMYQMTAAHRTYAMNTVVKVTNLHNKKSVIVRINDRGPFYHTRDIDLSYVAARKLGMAKKGIERIKIEVIRAAKQPRNSKKFHRKEKIQVASFYSKELAYTFKKKHQLKNSIIIRKYIKKKKKSTYKVIVKCTPWEAKKLIQSKKFTGAHKV